jgi:predicted small metal-binding protein
VVPKVISCICGQSVQGDTEEEVLDKAEDHVRSDHPDLVDEFPRTTLATMIEDV